MRSNIDGGEMMFDDSINEKIDAEFADLDSLPEHEVSRIERAKERFSSG